MVLDKEQRFKYRHCYRRFTEHSSESLTEPRMRRASSSSSDSLPDLIPIPSKKSIPHPTIESILQNFLISMAEITFDHINTSDVIDFYLGKMEMFPWPKLFINVQYFHSQMENFAQKLAFINLFSDASERLKEAQSLYLNYILAKFLTAKSGQDQLWWLFDGHLNDIMLEKDILPSKKAQSIVRAVSIRETYSYFTLFIGPKSADDLFRGLELVNSFEFPSALNGLLGQYFLLHKELKIPKENLEGSSKQESQILERLTTDIESMILSETQQFGKKIDRSDLNTLCQCLIRQAELVNFS